MFDKTIGILKYSVILFCVVQIAVGTRVSAQVSTNGSNGQLDVSFVKEEIKIVKGQIISNVIRIKNNSNDSISLYISMNFPPFWKTLFNADRLYTLGSRDSLFIPVRIIPDVMMKGDTKYYINAFIENEKRRPIAGAYFFASTDRISKWELEVLPDSRIYFKNNENTAGFDVNLHNSGNEKQDILMNLTVTRSNLIVTDTNEKPIEDFKKDISILPGCDTTFKYQVKYVEGERNFKNIDIENYNPGSLEQEKKYSIFLHSEEPRRSKYNNLSQNAKVDFIKLSTDKKVNPYGSDVLPLSAYLRVSNLLDDIVFSSLHLRGQKYLNNGGNLIYNASFYFSSQENFYDNKYGRNIPWYIGYFDEHKNLQIGYVNGGAIGVQSSGKGIKGEIEFIPHNWAGGYYIRTPYFFSDTRLEAYGFHHRLELDNFSNLTQYSHSHHRLAKIITDVISVNPKIRLARKHNISFMGAFSNRYNYYDTSTYSKQGYLLGASYTSHFFEGIWKLNIRGTYTSKNFGTYGFERWYVNHRSLITLSKDFELAVINNYNEYRYDPEYYSYIPGYDRNYFFYNSVNLFSEKYLKTFKPGLFYDLRYYWNYNFHIRGLNLAYSKYDITDYLQVSFVSTFGFSRIVNDPSDGNHFVYKLNTMIRYHNLSFTGFYNYGPLTPEMVQMKRQYNIVPQNLRASIIHQYLFRGRHLVLQTMMSYMYTNVYNHHSVNISPELFYFTNSGWRFSVNPTYTFYSSKIKVNYNEIPSYLSPEDADYRRYSNDNFVISVGIKKDFGIPIPGTHNKYANASFTAFYDMNGNKIKDEDEPGIENVVLQAGNWSVITGEEGKANIRNAEPGSYTFSALSLVDLKGWFPLIPDSLNIFKDEEVVVPFVKGVKVYGAVFIDQDEIAAQSDRKLDMSGIKITAADGYTFNTLTGADGSFEFYLPFGEYTITLDENILNGRYYIVKNNYKLDLSGAVDNMYITFHIIEKKRAVRIKNFNRPEEGEGKEE
ncbi:MAG: hypothetical protein JW731_14295 [Bacteroidales bacterium]|nr:hypothetical protein [Bacteroidales bacterium]